MLKSHARHLLGAVQWPPSATHVLIADGAAGLPMLAIYSPFLLFFFLLLFLLLFFFSAFSPLFCGGANTELHTLP